MKHFSMALKIVNFIFLGCIILGFGYFFMLSKNPSWGDIIGAVAKFNLTQSTIEYRFAEKNIKTATSYILKIREKLKGDAFTPMTDSQLEVYIGLVQKYSQYESIPREFIDAITAGESDWNPEAKGWAGEYGLMQIMKETFRIVISCSVYRGREEAVHKNIYYNLFASMEHLVYVRNWLRNELGRQPSIEEVSWAYNAGQKPALAYINSKDKRYLPETTLDYGKKIRYYYTHYCAGNYAVSYDEHLRQQREATNK